MTLEIAQHIGDDMVRAIALQPTDGLVRGAEVFDTGSSITVPVGNGTLGHVFNTLGEPLDVAADELNIRGAVVDPPPAAALRPARVQDRDVRDRHQGHRLAYPLRGRRQDRPVRWCRYRQDGAHPRDDLPRRRELRWRVGVRRRGRADARGQRPHRRDDRVRRAARRLRWCSARWTSRRAPGCGSRSRRSPWPSTSATCRSRMCCCSSTTSSGSRRPAPRCRRCSAACRPPWVTSRRWPTRWVSCRSASPRRAVTRSPRCRRSTSPARRLHRSGAGDHLRAPRCHHRAVPRDLGEGHLPGGRPVELDLANPRRAVHRSAALRRRVADEADPAAVPGAAGHHRDPRHRRAERRGQGGRRPGPAHRALPVAEHLSSPSSSPASRVRSSRSKRQSTRSRSCATVISTVTPNRRSSCVAGSRTSRKTPRNSENA